MNVSTVIFTCLRVVYCKFYYEEQVKMCGFQTFNCFVICWHKWITFKIIDNLPITYNEACLN